MKVLVTGATGLLGANVARALLDAGHAVRVTHRPSSKTTAVDGLDVESAEMTLEDAASVGHALQGCDAVVHSAGAVWIGSMRRDWFERVNIEGTRTVCRAAQDAGVKRMVHVSTVDALGVSPGEVVDDEETPPNLAHLDCCYVDTKRAAEEVVQGFVKDGLACTIVNPTTMYGPWDVGPSSGQMLLNVGNGQVLVAPRGGGNFVDVRSVASGVVAALERGQPGRRYILGGENLSYLEIMGRIARITGARPPLGEAPSMLLGFVGALGGLWGRVTGVEPELNPAAMRMAVMHRYYSSERARAELDYRWSDLDDAIADAWKWFGEHGYR